MKIAIPIIDATKNKYTIASSLSVNGYLCLYDSNSNAGRWMKTIELAPDMGELLHELERKAVRIIITEQIHPMALKVLVNKGFEVFQSKGNALGENIRFYNDKKLKKFNYKATLDFANVCGGACSSCETECSEDKKQMTEMM